MVCTSSYIRIGKKRIVQAQLTLFTLEGKHRSYLICHIDDMSFVVNFVDCLLFSPIVNRLDG